MQCLERRLKLWTEGDLEGLLQEGRTIQQRLLRSHHTTRNEQQCARSFTKLMMEGRVRAALRMLSEQEGGPPLALDEEIEVNGVAQSVRDLLKQKHPEGPAAPSVLSAVDRIRGPVISSKMTGWGSTGMGSYG